ncbi:MAG: peptidase domain-containing ABC transporter, partial [Pirellulaceae bacterium]
MFSRYHCVKQMDGSDCGAAALATVARHHGLEFGLQTMRDLAGTDRIGTNLLGLMEAAERIGMSAKAVRGAYEALGGACLPAIAHVRTDEGFGHFVVLHRVRKSSVVVADPARGVRTLSREAFCAAWTGYLLLVTPDETKPRVPEPAGATGSLARFLGLLRLHRGVLIEAVVCALLMTLLGVSTSYFVQHLIDNVLVRNETRMLNALGVGMASIILFRTLFGMLRHYLLAHVGRTVDLSLIAGYARHLLSLPMSFFEMRQVGEIVSRVNDAAKIREAISGACLTAMVDGIVVICTSVVLWMYDGRLAAVAMVFAPLWLIAVIAHHPITRRRSREAMEKAAKLSAHLVEDISGVETFKTFGAERARVEEGEHRLVRLVQSLFSLQKLSISMGAVGSVISGLAGVIVLWYGGHRVVSGALTIGELMFFYTLVGYLLEPMERLAGVNAQVQDALVAVDRLYQVFEIPGERLDDRKAAFRGVRDAIELRGVSFRYGCRDKVLDGVNLRIPAGATVAIVGESGCGKSTLLKLLTRLHDPVQGQILVDGVDLRDFDLGSLRSRCAVVSREPFIVSGTLRDNIALGAPQATLNVVIAAARAA